MLDINLKIKDAIVNRFLKCTDKREDVHVKFISALDKHLVKSFARKLTTFVK